jgi:hypothetical protein
LGIHGKRDPDAERLRIEKSQAAGFGQAGKAGRPKKDSTEIIEEKAAERMERLVDKALDGIERAMDSPDDKTALAGADKFFKTFHHPAQKVEHSGNIETTAHHLHMLKGQNTLSADDQNLLGEFLDVLRDAADAEVIEAEIVEPLELPEESG